MRLSGRALLALLSVVTGLAAVVDHRAAGAGVAVDVRELPLDPLGGQQVGALSYRGGLWIQPSDARAGGLSDLWVSADGGRLVAISDCGDVVTAKLSYESGRLTGMSDVEVNPLRGPAGRDLGFEERDAEGLTCEGFTRKCVVSFERRHRLDRYENDPTPLARWVESIPVPAELLRLEANTGVEALALLGDGRFLVIEEGQAGDTTSAAWLGGPGGWRSLSFPLTTDEDSGQLFHPTSLTQLPGGDLLVLERRFPPIGCRIRRVTRQDLDAGDLLGTQVARWEKPMTLDNFEGISSRRNEAGATFVYLVSDDNNCPKAGGLPAGVLDQRTLLMMFELQE